MMHSLVKTAMMGDDLASCCRHVWGLNILDAAFRA